MQTETFSAGSDDQTCHGPEPCDPDVGQQPHCDPAADDDRP
jgi:hypothetical protein